MIFREFYIVYNQGEVGPGNEIKIYIKNIPSFFCKIF